MLCLVQEVGLERFEASLNGLSPKLRSIAEHILKHPQDVVHKSITELAEVTNSSEATIFRLCKNLGLQGFQDLKITLAREIVHTPMQNIHEEVSAEDSMVTVAKKFFIRILQDCKILYICLMKRHLSRLYEPYKKQVELSFMEMVALVLLQWMRIISL